MSTLQERISEQIKPHATKDDPYGEMATLLESHEGKKFDQGKTRIELVPPEAMEALGTILTFGAEKYGDRNWEKGMNWSRCFGACMRHMWAWWKGEKADPETGYSHLWHAFACVAFLLAYEARNIGSDDRHKS